MRSQAQCPAPRWSAYSATLRLLMQSMALRSTAQEALSATALTIPTVSSPQSHVCSSWLETCPHSSFKIHIFTTPFSIRNATILSSSPTHAHAHAHAHPTAPSLWTSALPHSLPTTGHVFIYCLCVSMRYMMWPCVGHGSPSAIHYVDCQEFSVLTINEKLTSG